MAELRNIGVVEQISFCPIANFLQVIGQRQFIRIIGTMEVFPNTVQKGFTKQI